MRNIKFTLLSLATFVLVSFFFTSCQKEVVNPTNEISQSTKLDPNMSMEEFDAFWAETFKESKTQNAENLKNNNADCGWITGTVPGTDHNISQDFPNWICHEYADVNLSGHISTFDLVRLTQILLTYSCNGTMIYANGGCFNTTATAPYDVDGNGVINALDNAAAYQIVAAIANVSGSTLVFDTNDIECIRQHILFVIDCNAEPNTVYTNSTTINDCTVSVTYDNLGNVVINNVGGNIARIDAFVGGTVTHQLHNAWGNATTCDSYHYTITPGQNNWIGVQYFNPSSNPPCIINNLP